MVIPETVELWPRFSKVREAIFTALNSHGDILNLRGKDKGIVDSKGNIKGEVNGIEMNIHINGTIFNDHSFFVVNNKGFRPVHSREYYVELDGTFVSADGFKGAMRLQAGNGETPYEAYWLRSVGGRLRLEQVMSGGNVYSVESMDKIRGQIIIPGTRIELPIFKS